MTRKAWRLGSSMLVSAAVASVAAAQPVAEKFDAGMQVTTVRSSEFEQTDVGIGGRLAWHPTGVFGVEGEINGYPRNFPSRVPFSAARIEGFFGATVGPQINRVRPFAKVRPGFVAFRAAPEPIVCILIFPPPLSCTLASGRTLFAVDIGGGVEITATPKTFVRLDASDRIVRYPGPVFDRNRRARDEAFASHDFRFAIGAGVRF